LVWYFRGAPHVHIGINVADDSTLPLNPPSFVRKQMTIEAQKTLRRPIEDGIRGR
jgi:hypothetical protein